MEPSLPDGCLNASAHFEQLQTKGRCFRFLQGGPGQPLAKKMHQVIGQGVQLKAEGVRSISMATEPVGLKIGLPLVDAVLSFASTVVDLDQILGSSCSVGHHASDIHALATDFHLHQDPTSMGPASGSISKAGKHSHPLSGAFDLPLSSPNNGIGRGPKHLVVGDSDEVLDGFRFQEVQQLGRRKAGVGPKTDRGPREGATKTRKHSFEFGEKTFDISGGSRT